MTVLFLVEEVLGEGKQDGHHFTQDKHCQEQQHQDYAGTYIKWRPKSLGYPLSFIGKNREHTSTQFIGMLYLGSWCALF